MRLWLQIFLDLKWNQVKVYYWVTLLFDIMFVGVLIFSAYHFLNLVFCVTCLEAETPTFRNWSMNINYHDMEGKIQCFSPNTTLFSISKEDQEICLKDMEKCALFLSIGGNITNATIMNTWKLPNITFKCHKNFLRYIFLENHILSTKNFFEVFFLQILIL